MSLQYTSAINLHSMRDTALSFIDQWGHMGYECAEAREAYRTATAELNRREALGAEVCPGCGCEPGDGVTKGCDHPDGCDAWWNK